MRDKIVVKKKVVVKNIAAQESENKPVWQFIDAPSDLSDKESATATLTRINGDNELDFSSAANYEINQSGKSNLELAPGDYSADITLLLDQRIVIPEKQRCEGGVLGIGEQCYTIPKIDFGEKSTPGEERFPEGGLKLKFTITPDDLKKDTIVLYAISIDIANVPEQQRVVEDVNEISKVEEYSTKYSAALQPAFE